MFSIRNNIIQSMKKHFIAVQQIPVMTPFSKRMFCSRMDPKVFKPPPNVNLRKINKDEGIGPIGWILLLIPVSTFCLGTWQIKRKKWKEDLIESLMIKTTLPAVPLPTEDQEVALLEYRKVCVRGEFDHAGEIYLGPRSLLLDGKSAYHGKLMATTPNNASGYLVVTPFILSDTKEKILVNRGWVSLKQKNPRSRPYGQIVGEVELEGVIRLTEPRPTFTPLNKIDSKIWFCRDVETMAQFADTRPVFIDASAESSVGGGPIGGQTKASFRNEHFSYVLTWYGLCLGTSYMWFNKFIR